jgi:hypothetical protein
MRATSAALSLIVLGLPLRAGAALPRTLIFGGGYSPDSTQLSLETQVNRLAAVLEPTHPVVLFAGEDPDGRSVQVTAPNADPIGELLGLIFDRDDGLDVEYRAPNVRRQGPATRSAILLAIEKSASAPEGSIVFGIGHGAKAEGDKAAALDLWGGPEEVLGVDELARALDKTPRRGPIAFVLGECHSGAFTDLIYEGGKPGAEVARPARCALAAIPADREAAGCTPDIQDPSAQSYMALIAEALEKPKEADYDGDGRVSLSEAHSYARIHDATIDVPVASSEAFLRAVLKDEGPKPAAISLTQVLAWARPEERALLVGLRPASAKVPNAKPETVEKELEALGKKIEALDSQISGLEAKREKLRRQLQDKVFARWPELTNPYHRESRRLLADEAAALVGFVRGRPELKEVESVQQKLDRESGARLQLERQAARIERWLRAVEIVAYEATLRRSAAHKGDVGVFDRIAACEGMRPL